MSYSIPELAALLQRASDAYYNRDKPILTDEQFDALKEELELREPEHPFLKQIGAPVVKSQAVKLPYTMPSLTKIKPGTGSVESFAKQAEVRTWVLSDKLDGISVLFVCANKQKKLYLRGDGFTGVDVSFALPHIQGIPPNVETYPLLVIRGELLVRNGSLPPDTLPRTWVNGLIHQKHPDPEQLAKLRFIAYELLEPRGFNRSHQFDFLKSRDWETPWFGVTLSLSDDILAQTLLLRRAACQYAMDGIVVGEDITSPRSAATSAHDVENPKDMRAFKMVLGDQQAITTVVDVQWNASHQGYWIPRIQIQPVLIGGSRIEFLTGHNARFILENGIGKEAQIVVRKSGDVIPTLDRVIHRSTQVTMPKGVWDGDEKTAKHLKVVGDSAEEAAAIQQRKLEHFANVMGVENLGPGLVAKFVSAGKSSVLAILGCSEEDCQSLLGKTMGAKIYKNLRKCVDGSKTELDWLLASSVLPRGIGHTKVKALFDKQPDIREWWQLETCEGWSSEALQDFVGIVPEYELWRKRETPSIPFPILAMAGAVKAPAPLVKQVFCFTGFRSAEMETQLKALGHEIVASLTKKITVLVVADGTENSQTEKIKKARESGTVRILTRSQCAKEYLESL